MRSASPKLGFGLFVLLNVEIDADPAQHRPFCVPDGFGPAEKPAVSSIGTTYPKRHLASSARSQTIGPDTPRLIVVVRMQERDMKIPLVTSNT